MVGQTGKHLKYGDKYVYTGLCVNMRMWMCVYVNIYKRVHIHICMCKYINIHARICQ